LKNNFTLIENDINNSILISNKKLTSNFLDLTQKNLKVKQIFEINNSELTINFCSINSKYNKNFDLTFNFIGNNSKVIINFNTINYDFSNSIIKIKGQMLENFLDNKIHIDIQGFNIGKSCSITGLPIFIINSCELNATHSLNICKINKNELFYLLSKGLKENEAISMIIWSKFASCLKNQSSKIINYTQKMLGMLDNA